LGFEDRGSLFAGFALFRVRGEDRREEAAVGCQAGGSYHHHQKAQGRLAGGFIPAGIVRVWQTWLSSSRAEFGR
jgi:hypothetical protein